MRPLINRLPDVSQFEYPVDALLMMSVGECCAMCERPLLAESLVLDRSKKQLIQGKVDASCWDDMVLLCSDCGREAEKSFKQDLDSSDLIFPDRQVTFRLSKGTLFRYSLKKVGEVLVNEKGMPVGDAIAKEVVLVKGTCDAAEKTIDFFKLNTRYYDRETNRLLVPQQEDIQQRDRRLDLRTQAWLRAESMLQLFRQDKTGAIREALTENLRNCINHSGYWAVWVTVFAKVFNDATLLRKLFGQKPVLLKAAADRNVLQFLGGQGPHHHFPGTNDSWLD